MNIYFTTICRELLLQV